MWPSNSPRLKSFSYRGLHRYLITLTTSSRLRYFAVAEDAGALASQIPPFFSARHFEVVAYCIMPDHVHLVLEGRSDDADLRETIRVWKQVTSYEWKQRTASPLWQPGFHDRVLREGDDARPIVRYVLYNPVRAGLVVTAADYPWSGSLRFTVAELNESAGSWTPGWKR
jgi:putative transposase